MVTPPVAARPGEDELRAKIEKAKQVVRELCAGSRRWTMSIPARPDDDPDLVIVDALNAALDLLAPQRAEETATGRTVSLDEAIAQQMRDPAFREEYVRQECAEAEARAYEGAEVAAVTVDGRLHGVYSDYDRAMSEAFTQAVTLNDYTGKPLHVYHGAHLVEVASWPVTGTEANPLRASPGERAREKGVEHG